MVYQVEISPSASKDIENTYLWLSREFPQVADEWYNNLAQAILSLENFPNRCPIASESRDISLEIRQLVYQKHRILYGIIGDTVQVYRIRHVAQNHLTDDELTK